MKITENRLRQIIREEMTTIREMRGHSRDRGTMWDPNAPTELHGDYPEPGADDDDDGEGPGDLEFSMPTGVENLVHIFRQYYPDLSRSWGHLVGGGKLVRELAFRLHQIAKENGGGYSEDDIMTAAEELANLVSISNIPAPRSRRGYY